MEFVESHDYEEAVRIIKSEMASYYSERGVTWDDKIKLELYRECKLWTIRDNVDIGFAMTRKIGDHFYLAELHIDEINRNKGYGGKSLQLAKELAESLGHEEIRIRVFENNPAYKLYQRSGFSLEKELPHTHQLVAKTSDSAMQNNA
jgi:GNAT superfamily N-acetyltransferase